MLALTDRPSTSNYLNDVGDDDDEIEVRDIHALTPPQPPDRTRRRDAWETRSHLSSSSSAASTAEFAPSTSSGGFTTMSREFNALVLAGSTFPNSESDAGGSSTNNNSLAMIGEDEDMAADTNPLAIVADNNPIASPRRAGEASSGIRGQVAGDVSVQRVKREEVDAKITAWQNAKAAKINNRFKRDEAVINGWENEQVHKSTSWMKKVERKLEEKRARALEKMENEIARARRKAEERRASAEAKRGTKVARVIEIANLMRAVGRAPAKRSFF